MKVGFWNMREKPIHHLLPLFMSEQELDILIIIEPPTKWTSILALLNKDVGSKYDYATSSSGTEKIQFFTKFPARFLISKQESKGGRVSYRILNLPGHISILLVAIHFPSKLHKSEAEQYAYSRSVIKELERCENDIGHRHTIIVGDFNMNPFEEGLISADGFNAVVSKQIASTVGKIVDGEHYQFFYNPSWSLMGDIDNLPGTYFYNKGGYLNYYWHTFDQVILRPELISRFNESSFKIVTSISAISLLDSNGRPDSDNYSDHLPVVFNFNLKK